MNFFSGLFYSIARWTLPRTTRLRLNKYRGPGMLARLRFGWRRNPTVLSGPFCGLKYPAYAIGAEYFPKLLGTYEMELHGALRDLSTIPFAEIIIVGAGEGYYVGGLAMLFPSAGIVSYEGDGDGQAAVEEMAAANQSGNRVSSRGFCRLQDLREVVPATGLRLLVMDAEGAELELLDPPAIPALSGAYIIVEVHDCFVPGLDEVLRERFKSTHHCREIHARPRTSEDAENLPLSPELKRQVLPLMNEVRPPQMHWFILTPM